MEPKKNPLLEREFILSVLAVLAGIVLYIMDDKDMGLKLIMVGVGGYGLSRGLAKIGSKAAKVLFLVVVPLLLLSGCSKGMIRADAIDGSIKIVSERHDRLVNVTKDVNGDGVVNSTDDQDRETYLRTTKLLRKVVDAALER